MVLPGMACAARVMSPNRLELKRAPAITGAPLGSAATKIGPGVSNLSDFSTGSGPAASGGVASGAGASIGGGASIGLGLSTAASTGRGASGCVLPLPPAPPGPPVPPPPQPPIHNASNTTADAVTLSLRITPLRQFTRCDANRTGRIDPLAQFPIATTRLD